MYEFDEKVEVTTTIETKEITVKIVEGDDVIATATFKQDPEVFRLLRKAIQLVTD